MELEHIQLSAQDIARAFWAADYAPEQKAVTTKPEKPLENAPKTQVEMAVLPVK
jgi:hypothetical protein